ncbi:MAG: hypothetical protein R3B46_05790 [Phycisphaerales bacterium]|nr:hypothetical protein [Phycisphaerales bacterium]
MRTMWTIISVLALANLLAMAGFVGWLGMSDRLSKDRIEQVRAVFAPTNAQQQIDTTKANAEAEAAEAQAKEDARVGQMPMPADDRTSTLAELEAIANMRVARAEGEAKRMREALELSWEELKRERAKLERERKAFDEMRRGLAETEGAEQFQKAVALYESLGADAASNLFRQILDDRGRSRDENIRTVAAYLNAMKSRTAAQVIKQFEASDPAMAAVLLESIRSLGVDAGRDTGTDADARPNATAELGSSGPGTP